MKTIISIFIAIVLNAALLAETKVKLQDLPPAVQKTVKENTKTATLVGLAKEVEDGKTVYELETKSHGRSRDLMIDGNGAVLSVEEEVSIDSIPAPAKAAIQRAAAGGKITRVETVTKAKTVSYEAVIAKKGKSSEFTVKADGTEVK